MVLIYTCDDYTITIKTSDIVSPWKRFYSRVPQTARTYCNYTATHDDGKLQLLKFDEEGNSVLTEVPGNNVWENQPPVMFETETYHFFVDFKCKPLGTPMVIHPSRKIADSFDFYRDMLTGSIDFLNNPGLFVFTFHYVKEDGEHVTDSLSLEVVSPKLDTKRDLNNIKRLINAEFENYVFEYLSLTFQNLSITRSEKTDDKVIWLSIFRQIIEPYFKACRYIMQHANKKAQIKATYSRAESIKRWNPREEERFLERGNDAGRFYYRHEVIEHTINTKENRFVKHTLLFLQRRFANIRRELIDAYGEDLSLAEIEQLKIYDRTFHSLLNSKFFRSVGKYEGHLQESAVLQQRSGYRKVYKYWQMLKCGLSLEQGDTNIGTKQIWKLYEIWCFLVIKRLICKILRLNPLDPNVRDKGLIQEDSTRMMQSFEQDDIDSHIVYRHPTKGTKVELWYQHHFLPGHSSDEHSVTTLQVPDIVLNITDANDTLTRTYLFDAKYRVLDDKHSDTPTDEPVQDSINAMHRYRDAIYYGNKEIGSINRPESKEVVGGYILFPGRVSDADKLENKYYWKSIESINIGAFPMLPKPFNDNDAFDKVDLIECPSLEQHLRHIILDNNKEELLETSIPQRGLYYTEEPPANAIVYVGFVRQNNPLYNEFLHNTAQMYYTGSEDTKTDLDIQRIRYFMPIIKGRISGLYRVIGVNAARKSQKNMNNDNPNDGVRFFLLLDDFIQLGKPVKTKNLLHNADFMTLDEAKRIYEELKLA